MIDNNYLDALITIEKDELVEILQTIGDGLVDLEEEWDTDVWLELTGRLHNRVITIKIFEGLKEAIKINEED